MTLLEERSNCASQLDECAAQLLDVIPLVMRSVRHEMRRSVPAEMSVPQFRTLAFLSRHPGASLSELAEHLGLTAPSTSRLIDGLVERCLVTRETPVDDRRRVKLALTELGGSTMASAREATAAHLSSLLETVSAAELLAITRAMRVLRVVFEPDTRGGAKQERPIRYGENRW